jgi:hypothetical protein
MLHPAVPKTSAGFHYPADKINYSKDIGGMISIDTATKTLTVRECLWNTDPAHPGKDPVWGEGITLAL